MDTQSIKLKIDSLFAVFYQYQVHISISYIFLQFWVISLVLFDVNRKHCIEQAMPGRINFKICKVGIGTIFGFIKHIFILLQIFFCPIVVNFNLRMVFHVIKLTLHCKKIKYFLMNTNCISYKYQFFLLKNKLMIKLYSSRT